MGRSVAVDFLNFRPRGTETFELPDHSFSGPVVGDLLKRRVFKHLQIVLVVFLSTIVLVPDT